MKLKYLISIICIILIATGFGYLYFVSHAWGTWGDDSAGYIYLWGLMDQGKSLVYQDPLTVKALDFFGDEKFARWTAPTHNEIISPTGYLASKYPIGLSLIMYLASTLANQDTAIYLVVPFLSLLAVLATYLLSILILGYLKVKTPFKELLSLLAAAILGLSPLYYDYTICQPMRDIPALAFLVIGYLCLFYGIIKKQTKFFYLLYTLSVISFGISINIRETSTIIAVPAAVLLLMLWNKQKSRKANLLYLFKLSLLALGVIIIAIGPSIWNSVQITKYKEKFKKKDITSIAITSNFDHISSFSLQNIFNNQGKFRPGRGALPYYWQIMQEFSGAVFFLIFIAIGYYYLWKANKWLSASLMLWVLAFLALFSLWINPYSRYILPIFPILAIVGCYGLYCYCKYLIPKIVHQWPSVLVISVISVSALLVSYFPILQDIKTNLQNQTLIFKAISRTDLQSLIDLGSKLSDPRDLILFTGNWEYGLSETLSAHSGVKALRFPLEQKRYQFDQSKVKEFLQQMQTDYIIYIWVDSTTSAETNQFLADNFQLEPVYTYTLTFEPQVVVYKLTSK